MSENCGNCKYFGEDHLTVCKRKSPKAGKNGATGAWRYWPLVYEDDWCGEWKRK